MCAIHFVYMNRFLVTACLTYFIAMHLLYIDFFIGKKKPRGLRNRLTTTPRLRTIQREKKERMLALILVSSLLYCTPALALQVRLTNIT